MSVPDEFSTFCKTCSSYNLVNAILIDGEYYCKSCIERGSVEIPEWCSQKQPNKSEGGNNK